MQSSDPLSLCPSAVAVASKPTPRSLFLPISGCHGKRASKRATPPPPGLEDASVPGKTSSLSPVPGEPLERSNPRPPTGPLAGAPRRRFPGASRPAASQRPELPRLLLSPFFIDR